MKKVIKLFIPIFVLGIFLNSPVFVYGQNEEEVNAEVKEINSQIQAKKKALEDIQAQQEKYSQTIKQKQKEQASLSNQLSILDNRLAKAELDITAAETEIDRTNLEIEKVNREIAGKEEEINKQRDNLGNVLNLIYRRDQVTTLEVVLLNDSLTDFISQLKYLEDINKGIGESLDTLKRYKSDLEKSKVVLGDKNKEMENLKKDLAGKKDSLEGEKGNKAFILTQTKNSEKEYKRLLAQAKQEQEQAAADIASLEKTVRAKIAQMSGQELQFNDNGLIWPVPQNTITSYFHDPDYPFRYIFEHPAVDIRAGQGTTIKAAASGYVARAKDAGKGYSYIMLIHGDGLSTVYGHVSAIYVAEDEYVVQGQAIGRSGGMPGTPGAGPLTTGPHLHFEVRLNGIPVNPLEYLP
ncbi:MAG: peptidoglycan DD-metalloendopeptidase family protein [Patescibacteria group bacterium]|nr:peptidoglycan DD-metalloendopeptidase family protein [Patescibacteria group bacterium]MDD5554833.1 peptidoglycan DD-metalloendopeptidase family protein [Patescibacteria group bacterium]